MTPQHGTAPKPARATQAETPVGVLVVDDQLVFRQVAREVIEATPEFEILGEAGSGPHALAAADELSPDLILLDVRMPGMDGIEAAGHLAATHPNVVIVLITIDESPYLPDGVAACGAAELVSKQDFGPALLRRVWHSHGPAQDA
jgi:two-component system, NarL family, invasion response regulator UvrY